MRTFFVADIKIVVLAVLIIGSAEVAASATLKFYDGHAPEVDRNGGVAPWYTGQNGQYDLRVRIAGEKVKRYPWATGDRAIVPAPEYLLHVGYRPRRRHYRSAGKRLGEWRSGAACCNRPFRAHELLPLFG